MKTKDFLRLSGLWPLAVALFLAGTSWAFAAPEPGLGCSKRPYETGYFRDRQGLQLSYTFEPALQSSGNNPVLILLPGATWSVNQSPFYARDERLQQAWQVLDIYRLQFGQWQPSLFDQAYPRQRDQVVDFVLQLKAQQRSVCLLGQSSGAFLAAAAAQVLPGQLACLVLDSGLYDFRVETGLPKVAQALFKAQYQAGVKLDAGLITSPTLLSYSHEDDWVDPQQSVEFGHDLFNLLPDLSNNGDIELVVRNGAHIDEIFGDCDAELEDSDNPLVDFVLRYLQPQV